MSNSGEGLYHVLGLEDVIRLCVEHHVLRAKCGGVEVEMHPSAWASPPLAEERAVDADFCACGHSIAIEHAEGGCLRGCRLDLCVSQDRVP